jgi:hypothetical protein
MAFEKCIKLCMYGTIDDFSIKLLFNDLLNSIYNTSSFLYQLHTIYMYVY